MKTFKVKRDFHEDAIILAETFHVDNVGFLSFSINNGSPADARLAPWSNYRNIAMFSPGAWTSVIESAQSSE